MLSPVQLFAGATRLLCPWSSPGKNTGLGSHSLLQRISPTQGSRPVLLHCRHSAYCLSPQGSNQGSPAYSMTLYTVWMCVLSHVSRVRLFETLWAVAYWAPLSMGFSWQEYRRGLSCPPPADLSDPGIKPVSPASSAL